MNIVKTFNRSFLLIALTFSGALATAETCVTLQQPVNIINFGEDNREIAYLPYHGIEACYEDKKNLDASTIKLIDSNGDVVVDFLGSVATLSAESFSLDAELMIWVGDFIGQQEYPLPNSRKVTIYHDGEFVLDL